jgi:hypothetical protein
MMSVGAFLCEKRVVIQGKDDAVGRTWEVAAPPSTPRQQALEILPGRNQHTSTIASKNRRKMVMP